MRVARPVQGSRPRTAYYAKSVALPGNDSLNSRRNGVVLKREDPVRSVVAEILDAIAAVISPVSSVEAFI